MNEDIGQATVAIQRVQKLLLEVRNGTAVITPEMATQTILVLEDAMAALKRLGDAPPRASAVES